MHRLEYDLHSGNIFPGAFSGPLSRLPDFSDQTHRIRDVECTVLEMFNFFGDEICDLNDLNKIVNGDDGYCKCNTKYGGPSFVSENNWGTYKIKMKYIEVKSIDWVGVVENQIDDNQIQSFSFDPKCKDKVWGQNTYGFYWMMNTRICLGIHRLDYSHRTRGNEAFQNFSSNIFKSKEKSAVELCIAENKKAQIADIKLQHALIMSLPAGRYVDLRFMREAVSGLSAGETKWTIDDLVNLLMEKNFMIGDSQGFDGVNQQLKPVIPIPGGLNMAEITGYVQTIAVAANNISSYTGINEQLTGESANPEGLVGLQKLLINSSINAIYYVTDAMVNQDKQKYTMWCSLLEYAIDSGGAVKQAIVDFIGIDDTEIIKGLDDAPLHKLSCKVVVGQREIERAKFEEKTNFLVQQGVLTSADEYILSGIENPKERFAVLASLEKKYFKKKDEERQQLFQQQSALQQQKGAADMQSVEAETQGNIKEIYAQGTVDAKLMQLAQQLGLTTQQAEGMIKKILQQDRSVQQTQKLVMGIKAKADVENQKVSPQPYSNPAQQQVA